MSRAADVYAISGFSDPVSSLSHLAGAALFAVLGFLLIRRAWDRRGVAGFLLVFAFSSVLLLSVSGVYHLLSPGGGREVLRRLDHGAIFVLIAGTFTAAHGILFRGFGRWGMLGLIWGFTIVGVTLKTVFFRSIPEVLGSSLYLALGWMGAFSAVLIWRRFGFRFMRPLVWGALAYTGGAVLELVEQPVLIPGVVGSHEVFHFAVLAGLGFHWRFVSSLARRPMSAKKQPTEPRPVGCNAMSADFESESHGARVP